jgi:hypothetical protein
MATNINICDQILSDWRKRSFDLSFLEGLKVLHHFYGIGVIEHCCERCDRICVEFESEDVQIVTGIHKFFKKESGFRFKLNLLRKRYIKNKNRLAVAARSDLTICA